MNPRQAAAPPAPAADPALDGVVELGRSLDGGVDLLGGKGWRLHQLSAAGLPVPPGFCVTTALFELFLRETDLAGDVGRRSAEEVRQQVLGRELPESVRRPVLAAYGALGRPRVAVRSSGRGEDSATQSFAGQHDTVLDVAGDEALLAAVQRCWASTWSARAETYRRGRAGEPIAVVVQEMVDADAAGVLFTTDPVGRRPHRMVVESCWGLGEGLVSGRVPADLFVVDDRDLQVVEERVRHKVTRIAPLGRGQVGPVEVDVAQRSRPSLSREQLRRLAELALDVRSRYGSEQDIEWAVRDGEVLLLQARPITTGRSPAPRRSPYRVPQAEPRQSRTLWSRMDIGEIFTGPMTPLGITFAQYYQEHVHADCARAVGVRDPGDVSLQMGYLQGHVYLNVSYTAHLLGQCPPTRDPVRFTSRFTSEEVDLDGYSNPFGRYPGGWRGLQSTAFWLRTSLAEARRMRKRAREMTASRFYEFDRARGIDLSRLSHRELDAELGRRLAYFHDMHVGYMPYYINAFGFYQVLTDLCRQWLGDEGHTVQNRVKADMSRLRTVETAREIWALAQAAQQRPRVHRIIRETPLQDVAAALQADEEGRVFWAEHVEPFLRLNGTRGRQEMELTHPRWVDDPSYVFQMVRRYAAEGFTVGEARRDAGGGTADVLRRLPAPKRHLLERLLALYTLCSELRETTRMAMITSIWLVRGVVYEVGRRLVADGVLRSEAEVAYLDFADVLRYLRGPAPDPEAVRREAVEEAKRVFEYHSRLPEPPLTILGEHDVAAAVPPSGTGTRLRGLGASPGRVVARARVVEDLVWQADELQAGEVLVTGFTDASWTPLLALAGAVVTDVGSMLSHSSIVSRELGVPAVVNTKHATRQVRTGDLLAVDGDTGVVDVLAQTDGTTATAAPGAGLDGEVAP